MSMSHTIGADPQTVNELSKLKCPGCGQFTIGASGLGGTHVHCYGRCMSDFKRAEVEGGKSTSSSELK